MDKTCYYCGLTGHISKNCPKEKKDSGKLKNYIGEYFEKYVTDNVMCPRCNSSLERLGDYTPSCDLICKSCHHKYEVKSKCLSVKKLPNDIRIKHGNYKKFNYRLNFQQLDMFLIIYSFDRKSKTISLRKLYYLPNKFITNVFVSKIKCVKRHNTFRTEIEFIDIPKDLNILKESISFKNNNLG